MTEIPGHTQLTAKALNRLATAVAAELLGVKSGSVRVGVTDSAGMLAVQVTGPIRLAPLGALNYRSIETSGKTAESQNLTDKTAQGGVAESETTQHPPLLELVEQIRDTVGQRLTALTGRRVTSVILECTAAEVAPARRVK